MAAAVIMAGADNNQQKAAMGATQTVVMVAVGAEAAVAVAAAATAAAAAAAAAATVVEAVAVAAAETAATAAMAIAIAGGGQDKREVQMWFHMYQHIPRVPNHKIMRLWAYPSGRRVKLVLYVSWIDFCARTYK